VDCIVQVPYGAYPSGTPYYYDYDAKFLQAMNETSKSKEEQQKWLEEWVFAPKDWNAFLDKVGAKRLNDLRADETLGYSTKLVRGRKPAPAMKMPLSVMKGGL